MTLSDDMAATYQQRFSGVLNGRAAETAGVVARLIANQARYEAVGASTGVPWFVIAALHYRESDLDFLTHLHNGDPLSRPTTDVPANRPPGWGELPPAMRTWERSAEDALNFDGLNHWTDWSVAGALYRIEGFNGWGYALYHPKVPTPYLWAGSQYYTTGKYGSDGHFQPGLTDQELGAAVLLRALVDQGVIAFTATAETQSPQLD